MIIPVILAALALTLLIILFLARLAVRYVILDDTWVQSHRDTVHLAGSSADRKIEKFVHMSNANPKDWMIWISMKINRLFLRVTPDDRVVTRGLRSDPQNSARIYATKLLLGEPIERYVPLKLACPSKLTTPSTVDGVDGIFKNVAGSRREFYTIPNFHKHMDVPLFVSRGVRYFARMTVDCHRTGDWIRVTKHSVEIMSGKPDELKCMRLSYGTGLGQVYCWAYSKSGLFSISVSAGAYSASTLSANHVILARLRTGFSVTPAGVKVMPNAGFLRHAFTLDGVKVDATQVTMMSALLETAMLVEHFEIVDAEDVTLDMSRSPTQPDSTQDSSQNSSQDEESPGCSEDGSPEESCQHPPTPTSGPDADNDFEREVANPLMALCQGGRGSELGTGQGFDISRTICDDTLLNEPKVAGRDMIPPMIAGSLIVPTRTRSDVELSKDLRIDVHKTTTPTWDTEMWALEDRNQQDFINDLFGEKCKDKAELPDLKYVLSKSKPSVKNAVERNRKSHVPQETKAFLKGEPQKADKPARFIVATEEETRVIQNAWRLAAYEALDGSAFCKHSGFGNPEHVENCMRQVQDLAREKGYKVAETDFSAMDGTVNEITRKLERKVMKHLFAKKYHRDLDIMLDSLVEQDPRPLKGVKLVLLYQRRSGEAFTSFFNTIINLYVMWYALKKRFKNRKVRMRHLGIGGGDDGLMAMSISQEEWEESASRLGMVLKFVVKENSEPAQFLSIFRNPISGICFPDVSRFAAKFGVNSSGLDSKKQLYLKAEAIVDLWKGIPLISDAAQKVLELVGKPKFTKGEMDLYEDRKGYLQKMLGKNAKFKSVSTDKEASYVLHEYAKQLGVRPVSVTEAINKIRTAKTFDDWPHSWIPMHPFPEASAFGIPYLFGSHLVPAADLEVNHPSTTKSNDQGSKNNSDAEKE